MKDIREILLGIHGTLELRRKIIPLFRGNPGIGKTEIIKAVARELGVNVVEIIASTVTPHEISGMAMPDSEMKKMTIWDFDALLKLKDGDILFFDEILNGNPSVLAACLTLLQNRTMLSGRKLPDVMIVAAANPQGASQLTPQIKQRFVFYDVKFDKESWQKWMLQRFNTPGDISSKLASLILDEKFNGSEDNYISPRSIENAILQMIYDIPTPYDARLRPILEMPITNTSTDPIDDDLTFKPGESKPYLEALKVVYKLDKAREENEEGINAGKVEVGLDKAQKKVIIKKKRNQKAKV